MKVIDYSQFMLCAFGLVAGCVAGCTATASTEELVYQAPVGTTTWVFAQVEARAACVARPADVQPADAEPMYADATGWLRFGIGPSTSAPTTYALLDCTAPDGSVVERALTIEGIPADAVPRNPPPPEFPHRVIPALDGDPMAPSQAELTSRGYPPRPDPARSSTAYAAWLESVSQPMAMPLAEPIAAPGAAPHARPRARDRGENELFYYNWAGATTNSTPGGYAEIWATWIVPKMSADPAHVYSVDRESAWVGLGNDNLIQAGVADNYTDLGNGSFTAVHQGWYESIGDPGNGAQINFPLSQYPIVHGDSLFAATVICNSQGVQQADAVHGCMWLSNNTEHWTTEAEILPIGGDTSTVDNLAEWIVELPSWSGSYGLTNFDSVEFTGMSAGPDAWADNLQLIEMNTASGHTLAVPTLESNGDVLVTYERSE